jgi:hypothetical protein
VSTPQTRLHLVTAAILAIGFGSAIWIYLAAEPAPLNPLGIEPEDSKQYMRELELYGGKANVLAVELKHWFDGLWHGKRLAVTVACVTVLLAGACVLGTTLWPTDLDAGASGGNTRGGAAS